ncbi:YihY/virulence factor BrkB family protein [Brevundimonas sp.]|uniref:YihY/virulence factor BrkB family protein n=1 Tax=Brevundimonas sp. TaxID=1871086 RepID=UPI00289C588A|nr:YihY/virulence factor BrkB family protein [Brevundimonas sp.]
MRRLVQLAASFVAGAAAAELVRGVAPRLRGAAAAGRSTSPTGPAQDKTSPINLQEADQPDRGRDADRPAEIPARGWKDILVRTSKEFNDDQIALIAAGCTFYALLALFPGVTAFAALYGLFADVGEARTHVEALSGVLPAGAISLIGDQMIKVAGAGGGGLSLTFVVGLVTALWSANKAMKAVITGLNIAYEETEARGLVVKTLVPLAFTFGLIVFALLAIGLGAIGAGVGERYGLAAGAVWTGLYWLILFAGVIVGTALLYRFGPSRSRARWRWISWGSALAAVAWVAMSAAFTVYVSNFGNYDESYGALGAAVGFMTWTWLSSMVFLMGAELNAEIEHQTTRDTTTGAPRPLGARGAVMADTVGASA